MIKNNEPIAEQREAKISALQSEIFAIRESQRVCHEAAQSVSALIQIAESGDDPAVALLLMLTVQMIDTLNPIVERRGKLVRRLARNVFAWPALISRKRAFAKENEKLMDRLQLGKDGIFSDREWQPSASSTQAALTVFLFGQARARRGLCPQVTRKNKRRWFEENWKLLLDEGFKPEASDFLRPLGKSKAKRKPKYCKNLHPGTANANARSEIRARAWKAFDKIIYPKK